MSLLNSISYLNIATLVISIGLFAGAFYVSSRKEKKENKKESLETENLVMQNYESQVRGFKDMFVKMETEVKELTRENAELRGQNKAYLEILQNRSPELEKVLTEIKDFMHNINEHIQLSNRDLKIESVVSKQ